MNPPASAPADSAGALPPVFEPVGTLFERQVRAHGDQIAFRSATEVVTYGELNRRANRVARVLLHRDPAPGQRVALHRTPGAATVAAIIGILKAGQTAVILDPQGPVEGTQAVLDDIGARWVIVDPVHENLTRSLIPPGCDLLLSDDFDLEPPGSDENPSVIISPETPACLVFTSGSTGRPKGVVRLHRNIAWSVSASNAELKLGVGDRYCFLSAYHTGNGASNLFRALLQGATVLAFNLREQGVDCLADWLQTQGATGLTSPASVFRHFVHTLTPDRRFPAIRLVRLGSEPVLPGDFAAFRRHFSKECQLINAISCTEAGNFASHRVDLNPPAEGDPVPIGRPLPKVDLRLVDGEGREVDPGQVGEIIVRSPGVAAGYWHRPDLTAVGFHRSPGAAYFDEYRTGDLARQRPDGCLVYVGRSDLRVKIRGLGVDLQAVEAVLGQQPGIRQAAVTTRHHGTGDLQLVAFVVTEPGQTPDPIDLRRRLRLQFPEPMLPTAIVAVGSLPRTPNGKLDRARLALDAGDHLADPTPATAPRNEQERQLLDLMSTLLDRTGLGIHHDFFDSGGHSLLALRLVAELERQVGLSLKLADLFETPTVAGLAARLQPVSPSPSPVAPSVPYPPFRGASRGAPLFHIPGRFGFEFLPPRLAQVVGSLRPYFDGLQFPGLDGQSAVPADARIIAADLVRQIKSIWPTGPLCLSGHSWGGVMAYEVACQLLAGGRPVESVLLFDSLAPKSSTKRPLTQVWGVLWNRTKSLQPRGRLTYLKQLVQHKTYHLRRAWLQRLRGEGRARTVTIQNPDAGLERDALWQATATASTTYRPGPYAGPVVLLQSTVLMPNESLRKTRDPFNGWKDLVTGPLTILPVPSNHSGVFKEPIHPEVFRLIREILAKPVPPTAPAPSPRKNP